MVRSGRSRGGGAPSARGRAGTGGASHSSQLQPFSLHDEVSNTERRRRYWTQDTKLRHQSVPFITAGTLSEGATLHQASESRVSTIENEPPNPSLRARSDDMPTSSEVTRPKRLQHPLQPRQLSTISQQKEASVSSAVLLPSSASKISQQATTRQPILGGQAVFTPSSIGRVGAPRCPSPAASNSSEDVVVFKGRGTLASTVASSQRPKKDLYLTNDSHPSKHTEDGSVLAAESASADVDSQPTWDTGSTPWVHRSIPGVGWASDYIIADQQREARKASKRAEARRIEQERALAKYEAQQEAVRDYVENLKMHGELFDESHNDASLQQDTNAGAATPSIEVPSTSEWDEAMIHDLDDISTSSDVIGDVSRILSKRIRPTGVQYLVVYTDYHVDDARWLPVSSLTRDVEAGLVEAFEKADKAKLLNQTANNFDCDSDDSQSAENISLSDDLDDSAGSDMDHPEDEEDLIRRRVEGLEDEQLARILSKQAALGLDTDQVVLFDDEFVSNIPGLALNGNVLQGTATRKSRGKGRHRAEGAFPDASLMADVLDQDGYIGFDIMDLERPSLKPKKKGRRSDPGLYISDEELAAQLQASWEKDRRTKSQRKIERQQMHKEGLIGKKKNKFKMEQSQSTEPPSWGELMAIIEDFLNRPGNDYTFPPTLSKTERIFVHNVSQAFDLISASKGSEKAGSRQLTLAKSTRTIDANDENYERKRKQVQRTFFHSDMSPRIEALGREKQSKRGMRGPRKEKWDKIKEKPMHGVTYAHGEIVGSKAPEIGLENKGRAMLEKMGWSKGDALGAQDNKGLIDPIAHRFKAGRAGLR